MRLTAISLDFCCIPQCNSECIWKYSRRCIGGVYTTTNDPERTRGQILDLELGEDGLYALAEVTERGEQVLQDNPYLGVSARIVENYARSDGQFYPAAIQHVLGTLDPRIPALGSWQPTDLSNTPQMVVDLSNSIWLGEPGPPAATDMTLTDAELQDFLEVL